MNQQDFAPELAEAKSEGFGLDFKRVGARIIRFWYFIVLSLTITLVVAYTINRYSQQVYPVSASIIIREKEETSGAEILYKNALIDQYRNYLNEPYIIKSYPLIQQVVEDLDFGIQFYLEGNFLTTEAYDYLPIRGHSWKDGGGVYGSSFVFKVVDEEHYSIQNLPEKKEPMLQMFKFSDSIEYQDNFLVFTRQSTKPLRGFKGIPFNIRVVNPVSIAGQYVGKLNVKWAEEGAGVLNLNVTGTVPKKDRDFMNGLIARYQQNDLEKKNQAAERTIEFISGQLGIIKDSLRIFENQLQRFKTQNVVTDLGEEASRLYEKLGEIESQKTEVLVHENYYRYLVDYINNGSSLDQVVLPSSVGITDNVLISLAQKLVEVQMEIKLFIAKEKEKNPLIESRKARVGQIKQDMIEAVNTLRSTDKIKLDYLNKQINDANKQLNFLPVAERELIAIKRNYSLLENLYIFLMQKMSEAGISKASNTSDIIVVNPPMQGGMISPKPAVNYSIAVFIGLFIPFCVFVLMELFNVRIQSKEDIEKITSIPVVGGIGHNNAADNLAVIERPRSSVAESFRALRSNLNFFTGSHTKKIFMVSSSISGEGKTFTTINLATVFALSGKKTLIVGADMRKPRLFTDFKLSNDVGLSGYLSRLNAFDDVVQPTSVANLDLISGGPVPPNPSELLLTDRFDEFIKESLARYEYVLIDTPPLALVTDAFIISKYVDHTVFVVRQNYSPKDFIKSINEFYMSGKLKNISILMNDIYKSGMGYGYGYGQSYGYHYGYTNGYGLRRKDTHGYYVED